MVDDGTNFVRIPNRHVWVLGNVIDSVPFTAPTFAGMVQPAPPFVCVVKLRVDTAHPE